LHIPSASQVDIKDEYWAILCEFHLPLTWAALFHPGTKINKHKKTTKIKKKIQNQNH
jgi:hypothetical protein